VTDDAVQKRFSESAERLAEHADSRREALREQIRRFVAPAGDERVLDSGTGTGSFAFAVAPFVGEVVGVDIVPAMLDEARKRGDDFPNVRFVEGDITRLPDGLGSFDLTATVRTLHHVAAVQGAEVEALVLEQRLHVLEAILVGQAQDSSVEKIRCREPPCARDNTPH